MAYKLKVVLDELEGGGMITTDGGLVIQTLNDELGINIHHDLVITSHEAQILKNGLTAFLVFALDRADDKMENLASQCLEILGV